MVWEPLTARILLGGGLDFAGAAWEEQQSSRLAGHDWPSPWLVLYLIDEISGRRLGYLTSIPGSTPAIWGCKGVVVRMRCGMKRNATRGRDWWAVPPLRVKAYRSSVPVHTGPPHQRLVEGLSVGR